MWQVMRNVYTIYSIHHHYSTIASAFVFLTSIVFLCLALQQLSARIKFLLNEERVIVHYI